MTDTTVLSLLHRIRAFGPVTARTGHIACSNTTPADLQNQLSDYYWEARALLEEWQCLEPSSAVIATAERIVRNERSDQRRHATEKSKRSNRANRATSPQMPFPWR
jgi:hypothetical protein